MALPQSQRERIAYLLSNNVQLGIIASAVGISQGYLTQLLDGDAELQELMAKEAAKTIDKTLERQGQYDKVVEDIIARLPDLTAECTSLGEATRALQVLNEVQRKANGYAPTSGTGIGAGVQVNLGLIANQKLNIAITQKGVILELGNTNVAPMPGAKIEEFFNDEHAIEPGDEEEREFEEWFPAPRVQAGHA